MSELPAKIAEAIGREGPMSLERFWNIALFDRRDGYYSRGKPIGVDGDFTTAPEISQMFGELIGLWAVETWNRLGAPERVRLVEVGPGDRPVEPVVIESVEVLPAS